MIRKAIGAIITFRNDVLLVYKCKIMNTKLNKSVDMEGSWDFPKGGLISQDFSLEEGLKRELLEETGSSNYIIKRQLEDLIFQFPQNIANSIGYTSQVTKMFHVEFTGDIKELESKTPEIEKIAFFDREEVEFVIPYKETIEYFKRVKGNIYY